MQFKDLVVLLPCTSLEDLSLDRGAEEAEELLSAWSALFHPSLVAAAGSTPRWVPAEEAPEEPGTALIAIPFSSRPLLPSDWYDRAVDAGAHLIENLQHRHQMVAAAMQILDRDERAIDPPLADDFLALGFCHFQVELLTRQLRYMSNLDEDQFQRETVAAAEAAVEGDRQAARDGLQRAFDLLTEAREYFYPVETHLLDLTLVESTTLGESLRRELAARVPSNLLICGDVLEQMARRDPATLTALQEALEKDTAAVIGGEYDQRAAIALLPVEAILQNVQRGLEAYERHLDRSPTIFGRRRFGLSPVLPQILDKLGFVGLLHFTLDDGRFPAGNQSKIRWKGVDSPSLEALARVPLDATRPDTFLRLSQKLGDTMDLDHVATAVFAHWPGRSSSWYEDLKRMDAYSPVLGKFITITEYFRETEQTGQVTRYRVDQYRAPYLRQAVAGCELDPISRWVRYHRRSVAAEAVQTLQTLAELIAPDAYEPPEDRLLSGRIEGCLTAESGDQPELDEQLAGCLKEATGRFVDALPRGESAGGGGLLAAGPWSFSRRLCVDVPQPASPPDGGRSIPAAEKSAATEQTVVDVPAMGFAWIAPGHDEPASKRPADATSRGLFGRRQGRSAKKEEPPLAEGNLLRNEFFEAQIDPVSGALRSIFSYHGRGNRLSQQIAMRLPRPQAASRHVWEADEHEKDYSIMAADELSVISPGPIVGEIVCRGRLVDRQGGRLAGFVQSMRVRRGSRVLELQIDLDIECQPGPNPWNSYYAARFAWNDPATSLYRSVNLMSRPSEAAQLEAPHFIDLRLGKVCTTILTAGLPYHRRLGLRKLDTLLVVRGERARSFQLGIGVDLRYPLPAALDLLAPQTISAASTPPLSASGWLFHLDARNVIATRWEPVRSAGRACGFRVRLLETEGRKVRRGLRSFRPLESARKTDFRGDAQTELSVEDDRIEIQIGSHEWVQVEATFKARPV